MHWRRKDPKRLAITRLEDHLHAFDFKLTSSFRKDPNFRLLSINLISSAAFFKSYGPLYGLV
jgi:hypothetical protein